MEKASDGLINAYQGYEPPPGVVSQVERVQPTITPEDFFARFVSQRKPVVISGLLVDEQFKCQSWTNQYLLDKAGDMEVLVEQRGTKQDATFGLLAPKVEMMYGELVDNIMKGNDRLYMTTQDLERFEDDLDDFDMPKSVLAEPLKILEDDFPVQPKLLGNLVPYQLSMWHGLAKSGSSSGLHHDYHDNLYLLIRGRKRFRLFAPSAAQHMQTSGIPAKVHSNGLIVYRNKPDDPMVVVRSDGVPMSFLVRQRKDQAESELIEVEEALQDLHAANLPEEQKTVERERLESKLEECEVQIDTAMEDMLVFGCPGIDHSESESDDDLEPESKRLKTDTAHVDIDSLAPPQPIGVKMPDHFCDMTFPTDSDDPNVVFTSHPHLRQVGCLVCEIEAGDMLYLPASWFHEVTSYSELPGIDPPDPKQPVKSSQDRGHLAFNYWMYPPDGESFSQPYLDSFWPRRWQKILEGPPPPIQKIWSSDDEEDEEGEEVEEEDDIPLPNC